MCEYKTPKIFAITTLSALYLHYQVRDKSLLCLGKIFETKFSYGITELRKEQIQIFARNEVYAHASKAGTREAPVATQFHKHSQKVLARERL